MKPMLIFFTPFALAALASPALAHEGNGPRAHPHIAAKPAYDHTPPHAARHPREPKPKPKRVVAHRAPAHRHVVYAAPMHPVQVVHRVQYPASTRNYVSYRSGVRHHVPSGTYVQGSVSIGGYF